MESDWSGTDHVESNRRIAYFSAHNNPSVDLYGRRKSDRQEWHGIKANRVRGNPGEISTPGTKSRLNPVQFVTHHLSRK